MDKEYMKQLMELAGLESDNSEDRAEFEQLIKQEAITTGFDDIDAYLEEILKPAKVAPVTAPLDLEGLVHFQEEQEPSLDHRAYMERALSLALEAEGNTSPNPMVGCVLVNSAGTIVGEGYHHKAGEPHAEVNALRAAGKEAKGSTAYVTLEPCSHYGRTGPCCRALVAAGVKEVYVACKDPNPKVAGQGLAYLEQAGVKVHVGLCEKEALALNEKFFYWITKKRPFISLKYAMTLDGKIATSIGDSKWITGEEARTYAHLLRKQHDGVLVGSGTVLEDDPELTTRMVKGKNPKRIVLDSRLSLPMTAAVLNPAAETIIFTGPEANKNKAEALGALPNVEIITLPLDSKGQLPLTRVVEELSGRQITSLLVEGGSAIHGAFKDAGLADRVYAFIAPKLIGGREGKTPIGGQGSQLISEGWVLQDQQVKQLGQDILITGLVGEE